MLHCTSEINNTRRIEGGRRVRGFEYEARRLGNDEREREREGRGRERGKEGEGKEARGENGDSRE